MDVDSAFDLKVPCVLATFKVCVLCHLLSHACWLAMCTESPPAAAMAHTDTICMCVVRSLLQDHPPPTHPPLIPFSLPPSLPSSCDAYPNPSRFACFRCKIVVFCTFVVAMALIGLLVAGMMSGYGKQLHTPLAFLGGVVGL